MHGGGGGALAYFDLNPQEYITEIVGRACQVVDQIQFITNLNRRSPVFGGGGGDPFSLKAPYDSTDREYYALSSISGRSGTLLDMLRPKWDKDPGTKYLFENVQFVPIALPNSVPEFRVDTTTCQNPGSDRIYCPSKTLSHTVNEVTKWEFFYPIQAGVQITVRAGLPIFVKAKFEFQADFTFALTVGQTYTATSTFTETAYPSAGPHCAQTAVLAISKVQITVTFSTDMTVSLRSGRVVRKQVSGNYYGFPAFNGAIVYLPEYPLDPNMPPSSCLVKAINGTELSHPERVLAVQ